MSEQQSIQDRSVSEADFSRSPGTDGRDQALTAAASYEEISSRAFELYVKSGRINGRCEDNWFRAEQDAQAQALTAPSDHRLPNRDTNDASAALSPSVRGKNIGQSVSRKRSSVNLNENESPLESGAS